MPHLETLREDVDELPVERVKPGTHVVELAISTLIIYRHRSSHSQNASPSTTQRT